MASCVFGLHTVLREVLFLDITLEANSAAVQQHTAIAREMSDGDEASAGAAREEHLYYHDRLQARRKRSAV